MSDRYEGRRAPFDFGPESLPPVDADLAALRLSLLPQAASQKQRSDPNTSWARKRRQIAEEFVGNSELAFLNAQLISNLRKRSQPAHCAALFCRIWAEEAGHLIEVLSLRWQVSSVQTFADHGQTAAQREVGQALKMLFGIMKLYEFERSFSGRTPQEPFGIGKRNKSRLPLDMEPFSLKSGGLDINLITPVWQLAKTDEVIRPLVDHLLGTLISEDSGVLRRLKLMRDTKLKNETNR